HSVPYSIRSALVCLLDMAVAGNDRCVARHQQFNALTDRNVGTHAGLSILQDDPIFQSLDEKMESGAADADRGQRRSDGVGFLEGVSGDETKRTFGHLERD